jgi:hypothetical protein
MTATEPVTGADRLVVDLLDPELYRRDPHDVWAWMRANEPVYRDERNGVWGITRHADLLYVERPRRCSCRVRGTERCGRPRRST